jgi:hypothetical protein
VAPTGSAERASDVTERLRRLAADDFVAFCAALWRSRGYDVHHTADRFVAERAGERVVVLPRPAPRGVARLRGVVREWTPRDTDVRSAGTSPVVDVVVTPVDDRSVRRLADRHDARLVEPSELVDLLLYGVSRVDADALAIEYLGATTTTLLAEEPENAPSGRARSSAAPTALVAVVGVVCLVLAAGVAGVWSPAASEAPDDTAPPLLTGAGVEPSGDAGDDTPAVTAEATDGSTDEATARVRYPPGVGEGYLDSWTLARAHATTVSGRSYRLIVRQSDTDALDGDRRWDGVWQHAVVEDEGRWLYSVVGYERGVNDSRLVQYTSYTDGEFVYRRLDLRNRTVYDRSPHRVDDDGFGTHTDRSRRYVLRYLTTTEVEIDRVSWRPDEFRLVATGRPAYVDGEVVNYTATAYVDESGFVSELTVEYMRLDARDADDASVRFRLEYAAVDDTRVRPPGWYDEAVAATAANTTGEGG